MKAAMPAIAALVGLGTACGRRCPDPQPFDWTWLEVGVGTRDFIEVPWGLQVSPDHTGEDPYFNVALRAHGTARQDLEVQLRATVGEQVVATASHEGVALRCRGRWRGAEVGGLRLPLDPASLPPLPDPPLPQAPIGRPVDTFDTTVDTGFFVEPSDPRADVLVEASITEPGGRTTLGSALWFVYR